jgi:hypothetical protein
MAAPTNLIVSYNVSSGADYSTAIRNIALANGLWFTDGTGLLTFIPYSQILKITAQ